MQKKSLNPSMLPVLSLPLEQSRPMPWYLPTFHGDIKLTRDSADVTSVRVFELTPSEEKAVESLRKQAVNNEWAKADAFLPLENAAYRSSAGLVVVVNAPIEKVQAILAATLKPEREMISAVTFEGGSISEVRDKLPEPPPGEPQPKAATTVAAPVIGCPAPVFPEAEIRANRVLESFLTPTQIEDYRRHGAFISQGFTTGHRYRITHRGRNNLMQASSSRSLYDLDENHALCVHDWSVPAPEEMLALHLCLRLPGREKAIRLLPEAWH